MFEELLAVLNLNNSYVNEYMISTIDDLTDLKKINFYYFFLKYVLKDSFYIYNIPFFLKTKINFLNIFKNKINDLLVLKTEDKILNSKIEYLFETILDSKYYFFFINATQLKTLETLLEYYKFFLFESKKEEIKEIEKILNTKNFIGYMKNFVNDLEKAKILNIRKPIINYLFNIKIKNGQYFEKSEKEINIISEEYMNLEKMIKEKKIKNIKKNLKIALLKYFDDINNKEILLKIFEEDIIEYFILQNKEKLNLNKPKCVESNEYNNKIDVNSDLVSKTKNSTKISSK